MPTLKELAEQDGEPILWIRFTGPMACPTIPHHRADPYPYPCITPDMARMMVASIKAKPEVEVEVRVILVEAPVQYETIKRRFLKSFTTTKICADKNRTLTNTTVLANVSYVVGFTYKVNPYRENTPYARRRGYRKTVRHYIDEAVRVMKRGEAFRPLFLGQEEFPADWVWLPEPPDQGQNIDLIIGRMPLVRVPLDLRNDQYEDVYFDAELERGVLHTPAELWEPHRDAIFRARHAYQESKHHAA